MKVAEIRIIQRKLSDNGFYRGVIDGKRGPKTNKAIASALVGQSTKLPDHWQEWSYKRQAIAFLQLLCHENGIDAGQVDGFYGPSTEIAAEQLTALLTNGFIPRGFGDINPLRVNPHNFPLETESLLNEFYGKVCEIELVKVSCPWVLRLDWDLSSHTKTITINKRLADSLASILQKTHDIYGSAGIKQFGLDRYGGSMNCRKKRGAMSAWSTHAWGVSVDWFPSANKLSWNSQRATLAHPDLDAWWALWEQEGWLSLGRTEDRDWMHIQAAKRR